MKLYEINEKYLELLEAISLGVIPLECIKDCLDGLDGDLIDKIDNIVSYIKQLEVERDGIKKEIKSLQERLKAKEKKIESLKLYVTSSMTVTRKKKIETPRNVITIAKNPPKLVVKDEEKAKEYLRNIKDGIKVKEDINVSLLKELIKDGKEIDFAELKSDESLRIK